VRRMALRIFEVMSGEFDHRKPMSVEQGAEQAVPM
jgi:hypothetical protein